MLRLAVVPLVRRLFVTAERATSTSDSSAEFTASLVGKIFANSGVSNTRLLPFWKAASFHVAEHAAERPDILGEHLHLTQAAVHLLEEIGRAHV